MTVNTPKPRVLWDQHEFEALRAAWSQARIAEDEKRLKEIFNLAAEIPLLAAALDWANTHGIKFFIDHQSTGCGGYYWPGSGVVALVERGQRAPEQAAGILVHEIRHAWQDYHGFIAWPGNAATTGDFAEFFIKNALIEADALAFGKRAEDGGKVVRIKAAKAPLPPSLRHAQKNESADLGKKFLSWFSDDWIPQAYGDAFSKRFGKRWRVYKGSQTQRHHEFMPRREPRLTGIDITNIQNVLQLGKGFSGTGNYLAALQPDILPKQILRPSLANSFYRAAYAGQMKLTAKISKACLRHKLKSRLSGHKT